MFFYRPVNQLRNDSMDTFKSVLVLLKVQNVNLPLTLSRRILMTKITLCVLAILFGLSTPAMAYIDPGSGSAIMSAIIGLFVAIGIAVKTYWYKLKSLFGGGKNDTNAESVKRIEEE